MAGQGVTYAEIRQWAVTMQVFTARDLAGALRADLSAGERGIKALLWHGICEVVDVIEGAEGPEQLVSYRPLPPGPKEHPHETPPEIATPGVYSEAPRRGMPVASGRRSEGQLRNRRPGRVNAGGAVR